MKRISTRWVVASALVALLAAACSSNDNTAGTGGTNGTGGAGAGGSAGTGGSAGAGGTSGAGGGTGCTQPSNAGQCEVCAFGNCPTEICDCKADAGCAAALGDYLTCLGGNGANADTCAAAFVLAAGNVGAAAANAFATCMTDIDTACLESCAATDAGAGGSQGGQDGATE